jgi:hypothetical protein
MKKYIAGIGLGVFMMGWAMMASARVIYQSTHTANFNWKFGQPIRSTWTIRQNLPYTSKSIEPRPTPDIKLNDPRLRNQGWNW